MKDLHCFDIDNDMDRKEVINLYDDIKRLKKNKKGKYRLNEFKAKSKDKLFQKILDDCMRIKLTLLAADA